MNHRRHRVSAELFAAVADGGGGSTAVRWLASVDYSKRMSPAAVSSACRRRPGTLSMTWCAEPTICLPPFKSTNLMPSIRCCDTRHAERGQVVRYSHWVPGRRAQAPDPPVWPRWPPRLRSGHGSHALSRYR